MLIRRSSLPVIAETDGIIFDVDGVLIDVNDSIQLVHRATAEIYFRTLGWTRCESMVEPADVDAFKLAGGFNSDWDLAYAWLLLYLFKNVHYRSTDGQALKCFDPSITEFTAHVAERGGGLNSAVEELRSLCTPDEWSAIEAAWDRDSLQRIFVETYSGDLCSEVYGFEAETVTGPGFMRKDMPILDERFIPPSMKLGIATGRTIGETRVGLRLMGWRHLFSEEAVITEDDGFKKPDPRILELAVERLGAANPLYIGDTPDDLLTVQRYNETHDPIPVCMVLTGPGRGRASIRELFMEKHADLVADNVNAALAVVAECSGGAICPTE